MQRAIRDKMSATTHHHEVLIRKMEVVDIPLVYQLGNLLFHGPQFTTLYRT